MDREKVFGEDLNTKKLQNFLRFFKAVSLWYESEIEIYPYFVFMQNGWRKSVWRSSRKKMKTFFDYKYTDFKKLQNLHFPKGLVHGF